MGAGGARRPEPQARPEDVAEEAVPEGSQASSLRRAPPDSWEGEEDPEPGEPPGGRTSRTASLVSGLLTELYSCTEEEEAAGGARGPGGRPRRRDSLDSSTEASGSDVVLGGRGGAGDSRVLQELRERPSQLHQRQYLRQKGEGGGGEAREAAARAPRSPGRPRTERPRTDTKFGCPRCRGCWTRRASYCLPSPAPPSRRVEPLPLARWRRVSTPGAPCASGAQSKGRVSPGSHFAPTAVRTGLEFMISTCEVT